MSPAGDEGRLHARHAARLARAGCSSATTTTAAVERVLLGRRSALVTANSVDMANQPFTCRISDARAYAPEAP